jgi:hypothetical protein
MKRVLYPRIQHFISTDVRTPNPTEVPDTARPFGHSLQPSNVCFSVIMEWSKASTVGLFELCEKYSVYGALNLANIKKQAVELKARIKIAPALNCDVLFHDVLALQP